MSGQFQFNCFPSSAQEPISLSPDPAFKSPESSQFSGRSSIVSQTVAQYSRRAPRRTMQQYFVPRPFPPPSLANVPVEYIIDRLHSLAPHYWSKPETADCTIIVPLDNLLRQSGYASRSPSTGLGSVPEHIQTAEPTLRPAPRMVMKLHADYLSAHSTLLRGLFGGASPLDLIKSTSLSPQSTPRGSQFHLPLPSDSRPTSPRPSGARGLPVAPMFPRILPSPPTHPTIYLPVPDPSSFRLLVHYMYFGSTAYIEGALDTGEATWEGLARNVEFLGMGTEVKVCLGRWYGRWRRGRGLQTQRPSHQYADYDDYSDSDSDDSYDGSDDDSDIITGSSMTSASLYEDDDSDDDMDIDGSLKQAKLEEQSTRGRQRTTRRLGHATSDPGPIRGRRPQAIVQCSQSSSPRRAD